MVKDKLLIVRISEKQEKVLKYKASHLHFGSVSELVRYYLFANKGEENGG